MTAEDYNKCVQEYANGVYRYALKNLKDADDAKDIVQVAYEKLWLKMENVKAESMKSYLFTIAHNAIVDKWRSAGRTTALADEHNYNAAQGSAEYLGLKEVLQKALKTLPDIQRSVIMLRDYEGYSYEEIGEITKLNPSQVKVYIFRARKTLQQYIGQLERVV